MLGTICTGFNPRPSSLTGEPRIARDEDYIEAMVSIRARHR